MSWVYFELANGGLCLVDETDLPRLHGREWVWKWYGEKWVYVRSRGGDSSRVSMHRFLMDAPDGMHVDHINGNGLDNRRQNLRLCTVSQNQQNRHRAVSRSSGLRGVTWHKGVGKWQAQIKVNGKSIYLGLFADRDDAGRAYDAAAREHFGEYARGTSRHGGGNV